MLVSSEQNYPHQILLNGGVVWFLNKKVIMKRLAAKSFARIVLQLPIHKI